MNKKILPVLLILSLAGLILSGILLSQHYNRLSTGAVGDSFCNINEKIDCDAVNTSPYAHIGNVPVSGLGFLYYLTLFFIFLKAVSRPSPKTGGLLFAFLLSIPGLLYSVYLAYISFFVIQILCILCLGMYAVNILLTLLTPLALGTGFSKMGDAFKPKPKLFGYVLLTALIFIGGVLIFEAMRRSALEEFARAQQPPASKNPPAQTGEINPEEMPLDKLLEAYYSQPVIAIEASSKPSWGNPKATVQIVEFSDFQCPFCRQAALYLKNTLAEFKDDISFHFVNYPLDSNCNPQIKRPMHPHACAAAKAALCALPSGQFWAYHDLIFANQQRLSPELFPELAKQLGLSESEFNACAQSPATAERLNEDLALANQLQIGGTPSIFINGRRVSYWSNPQFLKAVIEEEVSRNQ